MCTRVCISYTSITQKAQSAKIETANRTSDLFYINVFLNPQFDTKRSVAQRPRILDPKNIKKKDHCTPVLLNVSYDKISGANIFLDISNGPIITSS